MSMAWVRKYYGVPAKRGGRIAYTGGAKREFGIIRSASNGRLNTQLDSRNFTSQFHPLWELEYLP